LRRHSTSQENGIDRNNRSVRGLQSLREGSGKMARGKKSSTLRRNEFLFSGRKFQVPIPGTNLDNLKNHPADERVFKIQACWNSFRIFHSYNAPTIGCLALVRKPIAVKAAKYQVRQVSLSSVIVLGVVCSYSLLLCSSDRFLIDSLCVVPL
jgi:hypothetical protein